MPEFSRLLMKKTIIQHFRKKKKRQIRTGAKIWSFAIFALSSLARCIIILLKMY